MKAKAIRSGSGKKVVGKGRLVRKAPAPKPAPTKKKRWIRTKFA